jgi:hypothetical protein
MKTVSLRILALTLGLALATAAQSQAGNADIIAIGNQLGAPLTGTTAQKVAEAITRIEAANDAQLSTATVDAMKANPSLNPATIAGESLKLAVTATQIGSTLATAVLAESAATLPKVFSNIQSFIGKSSATAATGSTADPSEIADWVEVFIERPGVVDRNADAILIAKFSLNSVTAIGEIFQGRAQVGDLTTDAALAQLANNAIIDPKLKKAAQQIAENVGEFAADASVFAVATAGVDALASLAPIVTGVTVAQPGEASEVVDAMFVNNNVSSAVFAAAVKNSTTLAKNLGLVADAEEVGQVAAELGERVGLLNAGKVVGIKQTSINAIIKGLVTGLATRSNAAATAEQNTRLNRIDEIGEVGAYLMNAVTSLPDFKGLSNTNTPLTGAKLNAAANRAANIVKGLLKTAIKAALKVHRDIATAPPTNPKTTLAKDTLFQATVADDISGSVAQTLRILNNNAAYFDDTVFAKIVATLTKTNASNAPLAGKAIAGGAKATFNVGDGEKTIAQLVQDALAAGLNGTNNAFDIYENGTDPALGLVDLETDFRSR